MVKVEFLGPIGKDSLNLEASNLDEVGKILKEDRDLAEWLEICAVAVNGEIVSNRDISLNDGDTVALLPPVCGG